jgi:tetratricopeptide (TPR) repeat protein
MALRRPIEALAAFDTALAINPKDAEALSNRGTMLFQLKRYDEAAANYENLLKLDPNFSYALGTLALSRAYCCDWRFAQSDQDSLHAAIREGHEVLPPHGATLISSDAEDQLRAARAWTSSRCRPQPSLWRGERYRHDRICVAYLSADFNDTPRPILWPAFSSITTGNASRRLPSRLVPMTKAKCAPA